MKSLRTYFTILFVLFLFNDIWVNATGKVSVTALPATDFLSSIGANSAIYSRGENVRQTIECCKYTGIRWIRLDNANQPDSIKRLFEESGVKVSCSLGSLNPKANFDLTGFIANIKLIARAGALLAIEGCNEPNNWSLKYDDQAGGGNDSWIPVAKLHRDLYAAVKNDAMLKKYPVWSTTETGAQADNCGMQYLTVPPGAQTLMPDGTTYADVACCHNYFVHPDLLPVQNNQTWIASDPSRACKVDGLYANFGNTWAKHYSGYPEAKLQVLPRVTTETGATISGKITEEIQGLMYLSTYLAQYTRGWTHTAIYILKDRSDEDASLTYGIYQPNYTPRLAAIYLHNLTTILADHPSKQSLKKLAYKIPNQPETVHDLLLQKSDGKLFLLLWDEHFAGGTDNIRVDFCKTFKKAKVYNPVIGTHTVNILNNVSSIALSMSNHPYVIELEK